MIPTKNIIKELLKKIILFNRKVVYRVRFYRKNISIDPTSYVSLRSIVRLTDGGSITIGKNCEIHAYAILDSSGGNIKIGDFCSINPFSVIYGHGNTIIENGVRIAAQTVIIPANHVFRTTTPIYKSGITKIGIHIKTNVWIGTGAKILDGVRIGENSVIAAGAVVTHSVPDQHIALGIPAKSIAFEKNDDHKPY